MLRPLQLLCFCLVPLGVFGQIDDAAPVRYAPDSLVTELEGLFDELARKHPGFYRYVTPTDYQRAIDSVLTQIDRPMTELEVYRLVKPLIAKMGCLHTGIMVSDATMTRLNAVPNVMPLQVSYQEGAVFVTRGLHDDLVGQEGAEVLSVNGRPMVEVYQQLLAHIPMDGHNQTGKHAILRSEFALWYRTLISDTTSFSLRLRQSGEEFSVIVPAILSADFPSFETQPQDPLQFEIREGYGWLRIQSFAKSYHREQGTRFKAVIDDAFQVLREESMDTLVIDLRGNTGGTDSYASYLVSHLLSGQYSYWDRIEVVPAVAQDVKGTARLFYGKPLPPTSSQDTLWHWQKSGWFTREFDYYQIQKAVTQPYQGVVYVLIDGLCMSSCADVAAVLHHQGRATFLGEETGGGYQGNTSGMIPSVELDTGLRVDIPLLKYTNAVNPTVNVGRGTIPDVMVPQALYEKEDATLAAFERLFLQRP
ncbi:MAG TPA: hypothetical protein DCR93_11525 [Cytophagales bacterium]|nr:hypothetical protein [Cytophagales bacterium]HAP60089.1 hypothetical protein [Cytophagales bacterium]